MRDPSPDSSFHSPFPSRCFPMTANKKGKSKKDGIVIRDMGCAPPLWLISKRFMQRPDDSPLYFILLVTNLFLPSIYFYLYNCFRMLFIPKAEYWWAAVEAMFSANRTFMFKGLASNQFIATSKTSTAPSVSIHLARWLLWTDYP